MKIKCMLIALLFALFNCSNDTNTNPVETKDIVGKWELKPSDSTFFQYYFINTDSLIISSIGHHDTDSIYGNYSLDHDTLSFSGIWANTDSLEFTYKYLLYDDSLLLNPIDSLADIYNHNIYIEMGYTDQADYPEYLTYLKVD